MAVAMIRSPKTSPQLRKLWSRFRVEELMVLAELVATRAARSC